MKRDYSEDKILLYAMFGVILVTIGILIAAIVFDRPYIVFASIIAISTFIVALCSLIIIIIIRELIGIYKNK